MNKLPLIGIIDTGTSNIKSVTYACQINNIKTKIITSYENIESLDGLIIPGIGSFNVVMKNLKLRKLDKFILEYLEKLKPAFFICVGMQILFSSSEEFTKTNGLNYFKGEVKKIPRKINGNKIKIPIIGWNSIKQEKKSKLFEKIPIRSNLYFTHSFFVEPFDKKIIHSTSNYYGFNYCSSISENNVYATQFHPEKSSLTGMKIYKNFKEICLANK